MSYLTVESELAHEIKNPLSILKMNVEVLSMEVDENSKKKLMIMKNEINKIDEVVKRFLDFKEVSDSSKDNIYLKDVIEKIIDGNAITYPNIKFNLYCQEEDLSIIGHEYHMNMVFSNLIKNSVEAMEEKGSINIKIIQQDGIGIVSVEDDGVGILREYEDNILENFFTTKQHGSGVGLTIVSNIISIYKGSFHIANNDEKGVTATVKLPLEY